MLLLHGTRDLVLPHAYLARLADAASPARRGEGALRPRTCTVEGAAHDMRATRFRCELLGALGPWLREDVRVRGA